MKLQTIIIGVLSLTIGGLVVYQIHTEETYEAQSAGVATLESDQARAVMAAMAALQTTSVPDNMFGSIAPDCVVADRIRLDELLSGMETLAASELQELQALYGQCGDYFELQRALKAKRLEFEVARLAELHTEFSSFQTEANVELLENLKTLVVLENEIASKMLALASIQADIITALVTGQRPGGATISALLVRAQEIRENVTFQSQEATTLRSKLVP